MQVGLPATPPIGDHELVERYLRGEALAFDLLLKRYQSGIYFMVRQYFPREERAEEIFQEVFLKVLERLQKLESSGSFRAWLYTLCRNHCIDRLRYEARRPEIPESPQEEDGNFSFLSQAPHDSPDASTLAYRRELSQGLAQALLSLPIEQRETFILKEQGGLSLEEIAELMQVSVNTVKSRMRYALSHLRNSLRHRGFVKEVFS